MLLERTHYFYGQGYNNLTVSDKSDLNHTYPFPTCTLTRRHNTAYIHPLNDTNPWLVNISVAT